MKVFVVFFLCILVSVSFAKPRRAQKKSFVYFAPAFSSTNSIAPLSGAQQAIGGSLGFGTYLNSSLALRFQAFYTQGSQPGVPLSASLPGPPSVSVSGSQISGLSTAGATIGFQYFLLDTWILPYVAVDVGAAWNQTTTSLTVSGNTQNFSASSSVGILALGSLGLKIPLTPVFFLFTEDSAGTNGGTNFNLLRGGIGFSL